MDNEKERENFLDGLKVKDITNQRTDVSSGQDNKKRGDIRPGVKVLVVQKHHQKTGEATEGIVKDILTNSQNHHRGIKVRLQSGIVGRVQKIII